MQLLKHGSDIIVSFGETFTFVDRSGEEYTVTFKEGYTFEWESLNGSTGSVSKIDPDGIQDIVIDKKENSIEFFRCFGRVTDETKEKAPVEGKLKLEFFSPQYR